MKLNSILYFAACAGVLFTNSCSPTMGENQLKYTHTSLVDGDAYQFFQVAGGKIVYAIAQAEYIESTATDPQVKELASKVREVYADIVPGLDTLSARYQVDFPVNTGEEFKAPEGTSAVSTDSTSVDSTTVAHAHTASKEVTEAEYKHYIQHEIAEVRKQFGRLKRNTNGDLSAFAKEKSHGLDELYVLAGGKLEEGGHH